MPVAEYEALAIEVSRTIVEGCQLRSRITHDGLKRLLMTGQRTTHFDAPGPPTVADQARADCEHAIFELYPADPAIASPRPTYGYFFDRDEPPGEPVRAEITVMLSHFGNAVLVLRDEVRDDATITFGDSMVLTDNGAVARAAPTEATDPHHRANDHEACDLLAAGTAAEHHDERHASEYVEAQIHVPVTPSSVERVVFLLQVGPDEELTELLRAHDIPWELG